MTAGVGVHRDGRGRACETAGPAMDRAVKGAQLAGARSLPPVWVPDEGPQGFVDAQPLARPPGRGGENGEGVAQQVAGAGQLVERVGVEPDEFLRAALRYADDGVVLCRSRGASRGSSGRGRRDPGRVGVAAASGQDADGRPERRPGRPGLSGLPFPSPHVGAVVGAAAARALLPASLARQKAMKRLREKVKARTGRTGSGSISAT